MSAHQSEPPARDPTVPADARAEFASLGEADAWADRYRRDVRRQRWGMVAIQLGVLAAMVVAALGYLQYRAYQDRFLRAADAALRDSDPDGAVEALRSHLALFPDAGDARLRLAGVLEAEGELDAARRLLEAALETGTLGRHQALFELTAIEYRERIRHARAAFDQRDWPAAATAYEDAAAYLMSQGSVDHDDRVSAARYEAAVTHLRRDDPDTAEELLRGIRQRDPDYEPELVESQLDLIDSQRRSLAR